MVRIWYSVCITEEDFTLLTSALQDLSTTSELRTLTEGVMELSADQLSQMKIVWATWLRLSERKGPWVASLREKANSSDRGREDGICHYMHAVPKAHRISTQHFLDTGIFHTTTNSKKLTRQNPTLTGRGLFNPHSVSSDFYYSIPSDVLPFTGWDYKVIKKNHYADSLPKMYTIYLSKILQKSLEKVTSGQVKFHFILCDVQNVKEFLPEAVRYDRITTSNLWDYFSLPALLTKFKGFLNNTNPHAVILTEVQNWPRNFMPEIIHVLPYSYGIDDLCKKALKDTQNPELVHLSGLSTVVEYLNLTDKFFMFLRASLLVSHSDNELASFERKKKIPSVKSLVGSLGLHLRDFIRNENTVSPFKWALNCRRVVMLRGYERALEWKIASDSAAEPAVK